MPTDTLSFAFQLLDQMSGPARQITTQLQTLDRVFGRLAKSPVDAAVARTGRSFERASASISGFGTALATAGGALFAQGLSKAGELGVAGARWVADSLAFKENTMVAWETLLGSKAAADDVYKKAIAVAAKTSFTTKDVIGGMQRLLTAGFKSDEAFNVFRVVGDVSVQGGPEAVQSVLRTLGQIKAKGRLQGEEIMQLAEAGVPTKAIYASLAASLGKSTDEVQKLITAGKVLDGVGIDATLTAITKAISGGTAGSQQDKLANTLSGKGSSLASRPFELLSAADTSGGQGKAKGVLDGLIEALDPEGPTGKRIVKMVEGISKIFDRLMPDPDLVVAGVGRILDLLDSFGSAFKEPFKAIGDVWTMAGLSPPDLETLFRGLNRIAKVGGFVFATLAIGAGVIAGAALWALDTWERLFNFITVTIPIEVGIAWDRFKKIGGDFVDGIWQGLKAAWGGMLSRIDGLLDKLPASVKSALGISTKAGATPALPTATLAGTGSPLEKALEPDASKVDGLMRHLEAADTGSAARGGLPPDFLSGLGGTRTNNMTITVNADGRREGESAEDYGRRLGRGLGEGLSGQLEGLGIEAGYG